MSAQFTITFTCSQQELNWNPYADSLLEFAEDHGIDIAAGCRFGDCGTCLTRLVSGTVSYTHPTLVQPEEGYCLPCSCVPASSLHLEA